jgi:hypothetical protein
MTDRLPQKGWPIFLPKLYPDRRSFYLLYITSTIVGFPILKGLNIYCIAFHFGYDPNGVA